MRLHVYWGDARQVANPKEPLASKRESAVEAYLLGLKETLKYQLPDKAPDLPPLPAYIVLPTDPAFDEAMRKQEQALAARRQAQFLQEMVKHRDVMTGQVVALYSRKPFATDELRDMADRILQDPAAVDRLMTAVKAGVEKAGSEEARKEVVESPRFSGAKYVLALLGGVGLLGIALLVVIRKRL